VLRRGGFFFGVWLFTVWDGKKEGEIEEERVARGTHRHTRFVGGFVGNSDSELVTSLYEDPSLNPLVIPSIKSLVKIYTSANRFFFLILNVLL